MGKFDAPRRLSKKEIDELFIDFAEAIGSIKNSIEAANLIKDLLTEQEVVILARRLQIARLINNGYTYEQMHKAMQVGNSTIARVQLWMNTYGDGVRTVIKRTESSREKEGGETDPLSWSKVKKKYPMYFWPELLLKEIVKSASIKEKKKLLKVVADIREKTRLTKDLMKILQSNKLSHAPAYGRV